MRPVEENRALSGVRIFAMHLSSVDLPEPLCPSSPKVLPCGMSKETSSRAQNSSNWARERCRNAPLRDWLRFL